MKNEFHAEETGKQAYSQPVLSELGDLKKQTMGDPAGTGGDASSP